VYNVSIFMQRDKDENEGGFMGKVNVYVTHLKEIL
jgi:hypothetical protein